MFYMILDLWLLDITPKSWPMKEKYVFRWTSEKWKGKRERKLFVCERKILKWRKDKPEIGRKYLRNIWLNTRLQRTQRTLKTRTKWKQTTQLRNGQIDWKDSSWKYSWKQTQGKMLSIMSHYRGANVDTQENATTHQSPGNCSHYWSLLVATQSGTSSMKILSFSTKLTKHSWIMYS